MQAIYVIDTKHKLFSAQSAQVAILTMALRGVFMLRYRHKPAPAYVQASAPTSIGTRQFMLKFAAIPFSLLLYQDRKNLSHKQNIFLSQHNKSDS